MESKSQSVLRSRPFTIVKEGDFFLLGGLPPEGVLPVDLTKQFLVTVPVRDGVVSSVFVHRDIGADFDFVWDNKGVLHDAPSSMVEVFEHKPAPRASSGEGCVSVLPALFLEVSEESNDVIDGCPYGHHKLGGVPCFLWCEFNVVGEM